MHKVLFASTMLVLLLCGFSCQKSKTGTLENTSWRLTSIVEGGVTESVPTNVTITAAFKAGKVAGSGSCNTYSATYTATGSQLNIGPIGATKMFCVANNWESRYFKVLQIGQSWKIAGAILTVQATDGSLVFGRP